MENTNPGTRVLIIDDHAIVRAAISMEILKMHPHCQILETSQHQEALDLVDSFKPDWIFLDHTLKSADGISFLTGFEKRKCNARILVLTQNEDPHILQFYWKGPVSALISKTSHVEDIQKSLVAIKMGRRFISPNLEKRLEAEVSVSMTRRELEVARLISKGHSNKEVASLLGCSDQTIKSHKANIMLKLGFSNSVEIGVWATKNGLI